MYAAKESGGNPRATHAHGDIDESAEAMSASINEMQGTVEKLAPNMGVITIPLIQGEPEFNVELQWARHQDKIIVNLE